MSSVDLSIVIPVFNEEGSLSELYAKLIQVLEKAQYEFEIVFINDGSNDKTESILNLLAERDGRVGVIHFRRNFGKAAALNEGFRMAQGNFVVTMDGDLQDDPEEIPNLINALENGYDVVNGWKQKRHDPIHKTIPSKFFNFMVRRLGIQLHDVNCCLKIYRKECLKDITLIGEMHRFVPVLLHWKGYKIGEIPVQHHPRVHGKSKYGIERFFKGMLDLTTVFMTTRYQSRPAHFFGWIGLSLSAVGVVILTYLSALWILDIAPIQGRPLFFMGILSLIVGVQILCTGLLAELLIRENVQSREVAHQNVSIRAIIPVKAQGKNNKDESVHSVKDKEKSFA